MDQKLIFSMLLYVMCVIVCMCVFLQQDDEEMLVPSSGLVEVQSLEGPQLLESPQPMEGLLLFRFICMNCFNLVLFWSGVVYLI